MAARSSVSTVLSGAAVPARHHHIDLLRGLVMCFMAADHVRDFTIPIADPVDLATVSPALFFFRWLAHFCAPVFAFLMGVSVWLQRERAAARGEAPGALARHLVIRGLLLIALEFTLVDWVWNFNPLWPRKFFQVIAALGCSMILLALFTRVHRYWALGAGAAVLALHNFADGVRFEGGTAHVLWSFLHQRNVLPLGEAFGQQWEVRTTYPITGIVAVALIGYGLGWLVAHADVALRRRRLLQLGFGALAVFLILRLGVGYGDPNPFNAQPTALGTLFSLLNVTKYPLSLQFSLMTLGPALITLALWNRPREPFTTLGRAPMFYYVAHIAFIHLMLIVIALLQGQALSSRFGWLPEQFTVPVWTLPLLAAIAIAALYPACGWYIAQRKRRAWLSYF